MKFKKPFFIAEISSNHEGSLNKAYTLIRHAKIYGADAVKLQTFTPEKMTLKSKKNILKLIMVFGKINIYGICMLKHKPR